MRPKGRDFTGHDHAVDHDDFFSTEDRIRAFKLQPEDPSRQNSCLRTGAISFRKYLKDKTLRTKTEIVYDAVDMFGEFPRHVAMTVGCGSWDSVTNVTELHQVLGTTDWYRSSKESVLRMTRLPELKRIIKEAIVTVSGFFHKLWLAVPELEINYKEIWRRQKKLIFAQISDWKTGSTTTYDAIKASGKDALSALDMDSWDFMAKNGNPIVRDALYPYWKFLSNREGNFSIDEIQRLSIMTQTRFMGMAPPQKVEEAKADFLSKAIRMPSMTKVEGMRYRAAMRDYALFHGMDDMKDQAMSAMMLTIPTTSCVEASQSEIGKSEAMRQHLQMVKKTNYCIPVRNLETGEIIHRKTWKEVEFAPIEAYFYLAIEVAIQDLHDNGVRLKRVHGDEPSEGFLCEKGNWYIAVTNPPCDKIREGKLLVIPESGKPRVLLMGSALSYALSTPLSKALLYILTIDPQFTRGICGTDHGWGHIQRLKDSDWFFNGQGLAAPALHFSVDAKTATDDLDRLKAMTLVQGFGETVLGRGFFYLGLCTKQFLLPIILKEEGIEVSNTTPMGCPLAKGSLTLAQAYAWQKAREKVFEHYSLKGFVKKEEPYIFSVDHEAAKIHSDDLYELTGGSNPRDKVERIAHLGFTASDAWKIKLLRTL